MGHTNTAPDPGSWALGHRGLVIDQGYRAEHLTAVKAKSIVRTFYGARPRRSYFVGCSSGGWQGLTEAQRYPHEYDGIVAGAPAMEVIHLHAGTIWTNLAALQITPAKLRMITSAVLAECTADAGDGVKDGLLTDPRACHFSPSELACRAGQNPDTCLTPVEVSGLQKIYDGLHYSSGQPIYPGWPRGVEYALALTRQPFVAALAASTFKDMVFEDPSWDYHHIDYDRAVRLADEKVGSILNNSSPICGRSAKPGASWSCGTGGLTPSSRPCTRSSTIRRSRRSSPMDTRAARTPRSRTSRVSPVCSSHRASTIAAAARVRISSTHSGRSRGGWSEATRRSASSHPI